MMDLRKTIESLLPEYLAFWKAICQMETPTAQRNELNMQADLIEAFCRDRGFSVRRRQFPKAGDTLVVTLNGKA